MTSDKAAATLITEIFVSYGFDTIIISPGSRNAPLILSFGQHPEINALSIIDERSAAFFALGIAQQTGKTVAIACTSGSAALNYAPAIAEAYYQKIPLLVLTADRPPEFLDQGDGQTIRQKNVFSNYIKGSFEINGDLKSQLEIKEAATQIHKAIQLIQFPDFGPVHINMPFAEPIYGQIERKNFAIKVNQAENKKFDISENSLKVLSEKWNSADKKLIIVGQMKPNPELSDLLKNIIDDTSVVILSESTSNLSKEIPAICIDRVVDTLSEKEASQFKPELLISFGGHVVSKMVKAWLRKNKPSGHWHIEVADYNMNTYQCLTEGIQSTPEDFFKHLLPLIHQKTDSKFAETWKDRAKKSEQRHKEYLCSCPYSDLVVFEKLLNEIPKDYTLQLGNSTPVRYAQLFREGKQYLTFSNRGTSGIDGTVSTASGAAYASGEPTLLITGDLGFHYDSNALMNQKFPGNLRIIIINNGGGGIFRFIEGPGKTNQLETFFEARHSWTAEYIAKNFDIPYYSTRNLDELSSTLPLYLQKQKNSKAAILEIFTPAEKNAEVLKSYFKYLKE